MVGINGLTCIEGVGRREVVDVPFIAPPPDARGPCPFHPVPDTKGDRRARVFVGAGPEAKCLNDHVVNEAGRRGAVLGPFFRPARNVVVPGFLTPRRNGARAPTEVKAGVAGFKASWTW